MCCLAIIFCTAFARRNDNIMDSLSKQKMVNCKTIKYRARQFFASFESNGMPFCKNKEQNCFNVLVTYFHEVYSSIDVQIFSFHVALLTQIWHRHSKENHI